MNYFELYGMPVLMKVEPAGLKTKFFELSRKYHPDYFLAAPQEEKKAAGEKHADVNEGFRIFSDPDETIKYVLQLNGLWHDEEKYEAGPGFMEEIAGFEEQLKKPGTAAYEEKLTEIEMQVKDLIKKNHEDVAEIIEYYQEGISSEKELLQVKEYYYRKKYLQALLDRIFQMRNIASQF